MTRKDKTHFTPEQRLEYAKLMVEEGDTNKIVQYISGTGASAVTRWKTQDKQELEGNTPVNKTAMTPEQQRNL